MRIALAQLASSDDVATNLVSVRDVVARASASEAGLVLLPEYAMYGRKVVDESFAHVAEPLDGPFGRAVASAAREHGIAIVIGMVERHPDALRPYNTLAVFDSTGELVGRSRKIQLYDAHGYEESRWISPAPDPVPVIVDLGELRIGPLTCYDLRFPELARALAAGGAHLLAVCASWVPGVHKLEQWQVLARARAIEDGCLVAAVSQPAPMSVGHSLVVDPDGVVIAQAGDGAQLLIADVDPATVALARERYPGLLRRRV